MWYKFDEYLPEDNQEIEVAANIWGIIFHKFVKYNTRYRLRWIIDHFDLRSNYDSCEIFYFKYWRPLKKSEKEEVYL